MTKLIVIVGFLLAFGAGLVVGMNMNMNARTPPPAGPADEERGGRGAWLAELNLTPEQREKMDRIWSEVARRGRGDREDLRRQYQRERDEAVAAIFGPLENEEFDAINRTYAEKMGALEREWRDSFRGAVERTRQILEPAQRAKYEELLKRHEERREHEGGRGPRRGHGDHRGHLKHGRRGGDRATPPPDREAETPSRDAQKGAQ